MPVNLTTKMKDVLADERLIGQTSFCQKCGQEYWVKWHNHVEFEKLCGPCYFKSQKHE